MNKRCDNCGGRTDRPGLYRCDESPHPKPTLAQAIVADIERELDDRRLGWGGLDTEAADATWDRLAEIVEKRLKTPLRMVTVPTSLPEPFVYVCGKCRWQTEKPEHIPGNPWDHPCCPHCHKAIGLWRPLDRVHLPDMEATR